MKRGTLFFLLILIISLLVVCVSLAVIIIRQNNQLNSHLVAINKFADHPALNNTLKGIESKLEASGLDLVIDEESAAGDFGAALQIAKKQARNKPIAMIGIATPSAQAVAEARSSDKTIVIYGAVTDPEAAQLNHKKNIYGFSDNPPVGEIVEITSILMPQAKTIGVIFTAEEVNSSNTVDRLINSAATFGIQVIKVAIPQAEFEDRLGTASTQLVREVDIIYLPPDNMLTLNIDTLMKEANSQNIPVISHDHYTVEKGALMALGINYFDSGQKIAETLIRHIKGEAPAEITNNNETGYELLINEDLIERFKINPNNLKTVVENTSLASN